MVFQKQVLDAGIGLSLGEFEAECVNSSAATIARGALVMMDLNRISAAVTASATPNAYGAIGSVFRHFIVPQDNTVAAADLTINGIFGVAQETIAVGRAGCVRFQGRTTMAITATTATTAVGSRVYAEAGTGVTSSTAGAIDTAIAGNAAQKTLGILLQPLTATSGVLSREVLFDGIYGFK
jgi:hypothetical protein